MTLVLGLLAGLAAAPAGAEPCAADCSQTACDVDCTEAAVRDAAAKANDCTGNPAWSGRTLTIGGPACTPDNTVLMQNDETSQLAADFPSSFCDDVVEKGSVCLTNDDIRIVGSAATFVYTGSDPCGQCAGNCPTGAALFTVKGNRNAIEHLTFRYFPEGIHLREGDGHTLTSITSDRICEDAITIDAGAGNGHTIRDGILLGSQAADPGHTCVLANGGAGLCGTDKAVQVNGGDSTIVDNVIDLISQPISIAGGTHRVEGNASTGSANDQNVCQSYTVSGSAEVTFAGNVIDHCKFGFRIDGDAVVIAEGNTVTDPWVSAFNVRAAGRLKAQQNRVRTRGSGFTNVSDAQRGLVVARTDGRARIDLGGGDFAGLSVLDDTPCGAGGDCSTGANAFCSEGIGTQTDIWNVTDCPCLDQFCGGVPGLCSVHSCAPLAADGSCEGSGGGGASIGARANCFTGAGGAPDVKDTGAVTTDTGGSTICNPALCAF